MNIGGVLTPDGHFTGTLAVPKEEQQAWLDRAKAALPADHPAQKFRRLVLHSGEVEADIGGVPLLGTVTADVKIIVDESG